MAEPTQEEQLLDELLLDENTPGSIDSTIKIFPDETKLDKYKTSGREHRALLKNVINRIKAWVVALLASKADLGEDGKVLPEQLPEFGDVTAPGYVPFTTALLFDESRYYQPHVQSAALDFTVAAEGNVINKTHHAIITTDGVNPINFSSDFDFVYGVTNGQPLAAGTYEFFFHYKPNGKVSVNVPASTQAVTPEEPEPNTAPKLTLNGANPYTMTAGETYTEPGYAASDAEDGDLTGSVVVSGALDTGTAGTYTRTYTVTDAGGLTATATRTVQVNAAGNTTPAPPTLAADDAANTLSASHALGASEIVVSENGGAYAAYTGTISVGNVARLAGYWKFKVRSAAGRNESAVVESPAFTFADGALFSDYFDGSGAVEPIKWNRRGSSAGVTFALDGTGRLKLQSTGFATGTAYDDALVSVPTFGDCTLDFNVVTSQHTSNVFYYGFGVDADNYAVLSRVTSNYANARFLLRVGGVNTVVDTAIPIDRHWRMRKEGNNITFYHSLDGLTWTAEGGARAAAIGGSPNVMLGMSAAGDARLQFMEYLKVMAL